MCCVFSAVNAAIDRSTLTRSPAALCSGMDRREFLQATAAGTLIGATMAPADDAQKTDDRSVPLAPPDKQPPDLDVPKPKDKAGWAIVGLGHLSVDEILPAFGTARMSECVALVSGHPEKAKALARVYGIPEDAVLTYAEYDRLADMDAVDVVYNVLPNSMHAEFTNRALKAGKHVLCEKPMAGKVAECRSMIDTAKAAGRKLSIAYRLHHEPMNRKAMDLCRRQAFGEIKSISSTFTQNVSAPNIRLSAELDGGSVGDVGVYCINACNYLTDSRPARVTAFKHQPPDDPRFREVAESFAWLAEYPSGVLASCNCGFGAAFSTRYEAQCAGGLIGMDPSFPYRGLRLWTQESVDGVPRRTEHQIPPVNQFTEQLDDFSDCVLNDKPPRTPGEMGLADMLIVEAIHRSAREGRPVEIDWSAMPS